MDDDVPVPSWWRYPRECQRGHRLGPGRVLVRWQLCMCTGEAGFGHTIVSCMVPGCDSA